ncbi:2-amino-4-hydroxy-6-hydroxymethyldihydropteridine diphosphokinase [Thalassotalea sp. HSM 43]|uniref:2-amino-4-hydroxy-6- hydroxymethyldihydropteridine diphosphokinase n=1 Tax=Thalassotalea sp. HSM 43 TaxID=2552945 RepID=UPI001080E9BD|nr:2-amino-4-hydroxy-6-hydroxymethyldihydropteridine diphosphokinase [Thalassotalea sp. HSM 43]QBY04735.1 2-amino-4-hydroxy-6-hydroxymethyldihydropteridine diphosphokinase [Thalassotalea sp. HSM 43]
MSTEVYIGLGSNLDNPDLQIQHAVDALAKIKHCNVVDVSSLYSSKPMGPQDQPDYMNAVALLHTTLEPEDLLDQLQTIEAGFGRVRKDQRWGARVLDLDILLFGDHVINSERLTVPHYGMKVREFVIYPLAEINQDIALPDGTSVKSLQAKLDKNGLFVVRRLHI